MFESLRYKEQLKNLGLKDCIQLIEKIADSSLKHDLVIYLIRQRTIRDFFSIITSI